MLKLAYVGALGMMSGPAAIHLANSSEVKVIRIHDRGSSGGMRDQFRQDWYRHGAESVTSYEELVGNGDLDGVVICAGKNGDDLPILTQIAQLLAASCEQRSFILHLSTVSAEFAEYATDYCEQQGVDYSNYPLTGGPLGAKLGGADPKGMLILASGQQAMYEKLLPVLRKLGHPRYFGEDPAAGAKTKLIGHHMVFNGLAGITSAAAIHAGCFEQGDLGSERQADYLAFLNGGAGGTRQWDVALSKGLVDGTWSEGFSAHHAVVDAIYAARLAQQNHLPRYSVLSILHIAYAFSFILNKYPNQVLATHAIAREMTASQSAALDEFMQTHHAFDAVMDRVFAGLENSLPAQIQRSAKINLTAADFC